MTEPHWTRQYTLGQARRWNSLLALRQVMRAQRQGHPGQAYRLVVHLIRTAVRHGEQERALALREWLGPVADKPFPASAARRTALQLAEAAHRAAMAENWADALETNETLLAVGGQTLDVRGRVKRNRAVALHMLGHLDRAVEAYQALEDDTEVWIQMAPLYRVTFYLSRQSIYVYQYRPIDELRVDQSTRLFPDAPFTWATYWWVMGHAALRKSQERLRPVRDASLRTFGLTWSTHWDRALWGLDLLAAAGTEDEERAAQRVRAALGDPVTLQTIGRGPWLDLHADWLWYQMGRGLREAAPYLAAHIAWCRANGYPGWASYWEMAGV